MKAIPAILMTLILSGSISVRTSLGQEPEAIKSFRNNPGILISALPSEAPEGYERLDQWIDTSYYSPAFVSVRFSKPVKVDTGNDQGIVELSSVIEVSIGDHAGFTSLLEPGIRVVHDYEKKVKVKGKYDGREAVFTGDNLCIGAEKIFVVKNRYLVYLNSSYMCDLTVLDQIIDYMDLDKLLE